MSKPLLLVIGISWGIALVEYRLAVPANRIGYAGGWSAAQPKVTQEAMALAVFAGVAILVLGEPPGWRYLAACGCLMAAVGLLIVGK